MVLMIVVFSNFWINKLPKTTSLLKLTDQFCNWSRRNLCVSGSNPVVRISCSITPVHRNEVGFRLLCINQSQVILYKSNEFLGFLNELMITKQTKLFFWNVQINTSLLLQQFRLFCIKKVMWQRSSLPFSVRLRSSSQQKTRELSKLNDKKVKKSR